jgi:hypothetical protein
VAGVGAGAAVGFAALARFIDDGGAASNPVAATAWGVTCVDGSGGLVAGATDAVAVTGGAAVRATSEASSGALSCFHQAQRGPD